MVEGQDSFQDYCFDKAAGPYQVAAVLGVDEAEGIAHRLGPKWAYRLRDAITSASEEDWQLVLCGLTPSPKA